MSPRGFRRVRRVLCCLLLAISLACSEQSRSPTAPGTPDMCGPFGDWQSSVYVLPYPAGTSYLVDQANCSGFGHSGFWKHGYDYLMDIGTTITASRDGIVTEAIGNIEDYDTRGTNLVIIQHADGTAMLYSHMTENGPLVEAGQAVSAGDPIGRSGVSGNTGGVPHLHQSLHNCATSRELDSLASRCRTLPFNFSNTLANPEGLQARRVYPAY